MDAKQALRELAAIAKEAEYARIGEFATSEREENILRKRIDQRIAQLVAAVKADL